LFPADFDIEDANFAASQSQRGKAFPAGQRGGTEDSVVVADHAGVGGLAEHLGEPDPGNRVGGEQVAQDLTGPDGGELVDVADDGVVISSWRKKLTAYRSTCINRLNVASDVY
jgi:hypothetical protein